MKKFKAFELEGRFYVVFNNRLDMAIRFDTLKQASEHAAMQNIYLLQKLMEAELAEVKGYLPTNLK